MKVFLAILLTALASILLQFALPWWSLALAAFFIGIAIKQSAFLAFLSGLLGTASVWWAYAWIIDERTASFLSQKIALLLQIGSPVALVFVGGVLAGVVGGFAAMSGGELRKLIS